VPAGAEWVASTVGVEASPAGSVAATGMAKIRMLNPTMAAVSMIARIKLLLPSALERNRSIALGIRYYPVKIYNFEQIYMA
jgi:hypothetical protein